MKIGEMFEVDDGKNAQGEEGVCLFKVTEILGSKVFGNFQYPNGPIRYGSINIGRLKYLKLTDRKFEEPKVYFDDLQPGEKFISKCINSSGLVNTKLTNDCIDIKINGISVSRISARSDNKLAYGLYNYGVERIN